MGDRLLHCIQVNKSNMELTATQAAGVVLQIPCSHGSAEPEWHFGRQFSKLSGIATKTPNCQDINFSHEPWDSDDDAANIDAANSDSDSDSDSDGRSCCADGPTTHGPEVDVLEPHLKEGSGCPGYASVYTNNDGEKVHAHGYIGLHSF